MHSVESRFVIRPSDILSAGVYVCTFQPRNFTGCGSEWVNPMLEIWVTTTAAAKLAKIRGKILLVRLLPCSCLTNNHLMNVREEKFGSVLQQPRDWQGYGSKSC